MRIEDFFSPQDLKEIEAAVKEAEGQTAGEIVPFALAHSDVYGGVHWRAATGGALLLSLAAAAILQWGEVWGVALGLWIAVPPVCGAAFGYLACHLVPPLKRALIPPAILRERVQLAADQAFLHEEVFATRGRTGILIFLSLFERRVLVMADRGINAKVRQEEWDEIAQGVAAGIRAGRPGGALAAAIRACGELLKTHGVARGPDDRDELKDGLRLGGS